MRSAIEDKGIASNGKTGLGVGTSPCSLDCHVEHRCEGMSYWAPR